MVIDDAFSSAPRESGVQPPSRGLAIRADRDLAQVHESETGPLRHLMRRSDMSGVGGQADIVETSLTHIRLRQLRNFRTAN